MGQSFSIVDATRSFVNVHIQTCIHSYAVSVWMCVYSMCMLLLFIVSLGSYTVFKGFGGYCLTILSGNSSGLYFLTKTSLLQMNKLYFIKGSVLKSGRFSNNTCMVFR